MSLFFGSASCSLEASRTSHGGASREFLRSNVQRICAKQRATQCRSWLATWALHPSQTCAAAPAERTLFETVCRMCRDVIWKQLVGGIAPDSTDVKSWGHLCAPCCAPWPCAAGCDICHLHEGAPVYRGMRLPSSGSGRAVHRGGGSRQVRRSLHALRLGLFVVPGNISNVARESGAQQAGNSICAASDNIIAQPANLLNPM